jgi:hypothetical protein
MYPLVCLENESRLNERILANRHPSTIDLHGDDYLLKEETRNWLKEIPEQLK